MTSKENGSGHHASEKEAASSRSSETTKKKSLGQKISGLVPPWAKEGLKSPRAWKNFARCIIATFATLVLLVDNKTLHFMGQAGFFGLIVSVMLPLSMALSLFIFAMLTLVIGICLGWAWGCAAMAAGLRARDQVLLQQQITTTRSGFDANANIDAQYQVAIFHGNFLDPRSSTVFGVFLFVGTYFLGLLRAHRPKFRTLMSIFGSIIMDMMCSYGPLFPNAQYTLARMLIIPAALYIAIAIACTILIFPQSLNHIVMTDLVKTNLKPIQSILTLQDEVVTSQPSDKERIGHLAGKARGLRMAHVQGVNATEGQIGLLQLEITRGQVGAADLAKIFEKARELGTRAYQLASFVLLTDDTHKTLVNVPKEEVSQTNHRIKRAIGNMKKKQHPGTTLDDLFPILATSTADLRSAAQTSLDDAINWIDVVNHSRWTKPPKNATELSVREANLIRLKEALAEFRSTKHFEILEPYRDLFDENGNIRASTHFIVRSSTPSAFRCNVFTSSLISFCISLVGFLELLIAIEKANPKARIQLPTAFAKMLIKSANEKTGGGNPLDLGTGTNEEDDLDAASSTTTLVEEKKEKVKKKAKTYAKDPDANDPRNALQKFGRGLAVLWRGMSSPQGQFAFKHGLVSVALWSPQVIRSSAWFTYHNRGLWALIMAQTGLGVFAGEQIASFFVRILGTVVGLVIGMVVWYIGAPGTESGNPYGIVAATLVFLGPFLFMRILAPMQSMALWLMTGVTIVFVVGYSWVDEHIYQLANQGSGAGLAGRRALLVIIGFTAAFLVMLIPRPMTARQVVRRNIAKNISATSDLYAKVIGGVEEEADLYEHDHEGKFDATARIDKIRGPFLKVLGRMQSIQMQMAFASAEPGLKGPWPKAKYAKLIEAHQNLLGALALLSSAYARLHPVWCRRLERSDHLHPAFVADCLALFSLLHQSLLTGQPMPPTMPIFERLVYHSMKHTHERTISNGSTPKEEDATAASSVVSNFEAQENDRALLLLDEPLTWDTCHDEQLSIFATAIVACTHIANGLNELQKGIIDLVGVREMGQFEKAQARWGKQEAA